MVLKIMVVAILALLFSGCADSTGWRFEIGVSPVKSLNNNVGLKQEAKVKHIED